MSELVVPAWAWGLLAAIMLILIAIDLFAHRGDRIDSRGRALVWSLVWVGVAVAFGAFVALWFGADAAEQFFAAYLLEKSLSVDNLFLFVVIFVRWCGVWCGWAWRSHSVRSWRCGLAPTRPSNSLRRICSRRA